MIALRAPQCLSLGIATALTAGLWAARPAPQAPSAPAVEALTPIETVEMRFQHEEPACDPDEITSVVIRGQFSSRKHVNEGFAISFAGSTGRYTAMTDHGGYFEVRIPREDFDGDVCQLPLSHTGFSDEQMTLRYRIGVE